MYDSNVCHFHFCHLLSKFWLIKVCHYLHKFKKSQKTHKTKWKSIIWPRPLLDLGKKKKKKKKKRNNTAKSILVLIQNSQFFYITREIPYCQHLSFFDFVEYLTIYGMV